MLGRWKNFDELEESVNLPELDMILAQKRKEEEARQKFAAAIEGINLGEQTSEVQARIEEVKHRAAAKLAGGERELERMELADLGFGVETA